MRPRQIEDGTCGAAAPIEALVDKQLLELGETRDILQRLQQRRRSVSALAPHDSEAPKA